MTLKTLQKLSHHLIRFFLIIAFNAVHFCAQHMKGSSIEGSKRHFLFPVITVITKRFAHNPGGDTNLTISVMFFFFPLLCPPQMTEQRKNKQRLGLLGPPQANHLTHWAAPRSNATATWLQTRSKDDAETQKTTTIKTIHGFTFDYWCPNARGDNGFLSFLFCHGIQTVPIFYVASRSSLHPLPARRRCAWWMIGQARSTHLPVLSCARPGGGRHVSLLERPRCWRIGKRTRGSGVDSVFETLGAFVLHGEVGGPPFFTFLKTKKF